MAFVRESAGAGAQSGVLGNMVLAQTEGGTIARARPQGSRRRTEAQIAQGDRLERTKRVWETLTLEEALAWRTFALEQAAALPTGNRGRLASGWSHFSGLGSKFLMVHGGQDVPRLPPTGRFLGDALAVTVTGGVGPPPAFPQGAGAFLSFTADGDNREGVLTELLAQPLTCAHNMARPRSYKSLGFVAMQARVPVEVPMGYGRYWACAVKFVEAATGRQTGLIEIGRATISMP